jgi:plasmid stabilization system protein ParE
MTGDFEVRYTDGGRADLLRLFDHLLDRAKTAEEFDAAQVAIDTIRLDVENHLSRTPFIYRKVGKSPFLRELVIPFGRGGYVAMYEIEGKSLINILAVRHQLEDDYH